MKRTRLKRRSAKRQKELVELVALRLHVLERDQYRCRYCRAQGVPLDTHHVIKRSQWPGGLLREDNGVSLCRPCHAWTDAAAETDEGRLIVERYKGTFAFSITHESKFTRQLVQNLCISGE